MKKIAVFLASVFILAILLSACKSSNQCSAYGEYKKFKVESK